MPTVKELRKRCRELGITGYSRLRKSELERLCGSSKVSSKRQRQRQRKTSPTVKELRKRCRDQGKRGYSKWNKSRLLRECGKRKHKRHVPPNKPLPARPSTKHVCFEKYHVEYCAASNCLGVNDIKKFAGEGLYGAVYVTHANRVTKFIPLDVDIPYRFCDIDDIPPPHKHNKKYMWLKETRCFKYSQEAFKQEAKTTKLMGDMGIGPIVYSWKICNNVKTKPQGTISVGTITMEQYDMDLATYMNTLYEPDQEDKIHNMVLAKIMQLNDAGYDHEDLHMGNILVKVDAHDNITKLVLLDFQGIPKYNGISSKASKIFYSIWNEALDELYDDSW